MGAFSFTINDTGKTVQQAVELILSGDIGIELPGGAISFAIGAQGRSVGFENTPDGRRQSGANGRDEIEPAIIDELKAIGCDTAKSVLELSTEELKRRTGLEDGTIADIRKVLESEFN